MHSVLSNMEFIPPSILLCDLAYTHLTESFSPIAVIRMTWVQGGRHKDSAVEALSYM